MDDLYKKALKLGCSDFGISTRKNKRFYVVYDDHIIHFGSKTGSTYIDHHDPIKRKNWRARHSKIKNKAGEYIYLDPYSASYYSWHLLW